MIKRLAHKVFGVYYASRMANLLYRIPNFLCCFLPMKNEILLESKPDLACNTYELYRYFIKVELNKQYKLVWRVEKPENYKDDEPFNVYYIDIQPKGLIQEIKNYIRCNRARVSISCNNNLPKYKVAKEQINIYLDHGSQLKSMRSDDGKKAPLSCDYLISQSQFFVPYHLQEYTISENQIICTGLPRDDQFFCKQDSIKKLIPEVEIFKKVIIWAPTFRVHKNGYRIDCHTDYPYGLPLLLSNTEIDELESCLKLNNVLLIIKPHPAQNLAQLKMEKRQNIHIITSSDLTSFNIQINELLAQTDALITDYSSIYYDYLFVNKPIALTIDDYDNYNNEKGFVFEKPFEILKGELLRTGKDLCTFINEVTNGVDLYLEDRKKLQKEINDYNDGKSSERVYNFLMTKLKGSNKV